MRARGSSSVRRDEQPTHAAFAAALVLGGIAAGTFLWRTLAWPPAASPDAWAYVSWGEALLRGERPAFDLTSTTPKPLATVLGALASPLPPERAMGVVVALALGVLVAALFVAAARCASAAARVFAVVVFVAVGRLSDVISFQLIDAVTAALIANRVRTATARPPRRARPRRPSPAGGVGACRPRCVRGVRRERPTASCHSGDVGARGTAPLARLRRGGDGRSAGDDASGGGTSRSRAILGRRAPGARRPDLAARLRPRRARNCGIRSPRTGAWARWCSASSGDNRRLAVVLVVEANRGLPIAYRYLLPAIVAVALGVGFLVARLVPRVLPAWAATALAATGVVVLTLTTRFDAETSALRVHRILAAAPGVERTLDCGTVAVAGPDRPSRADMGALSAATRRSLRSFALAPPAPARGGVLLLAGAEFEPPRDGANDVFRSDVWPSRRTARRNIGPWRSLASSRLNHMRSRLEMWRTRSSSIRDGTWLSITGREWKGRRTRLARRTAPSRGGYRSGLTRQGRPGRLTSMRSRWLARASSA